MSDPLRTDPVRPADATADDKEARIEQLLLSGLDHYFSGEYERAINVWTRVAFLERGHGRARAYIDRARGALAERHRESEELLHQGVAALDRGETDTARDLITKAADRGAPQDVALVLLERLNRLGSSAPVVELPRPTPVARRMYLRRHHATSPRASWPLRAALVLTVLAGALAVAVLSGVALPDWLADPIGSPQQQVTVVPPDPLPVARSSDRVLARARSLQAGGHLRDALRTLDAIALADPLRPDADRLRADLQRRLLESGRAAAGSPGARP